jgi:hypothetical protein
VMGKALFSHLSFRPWNLVDDSKRNAADPPGYVGSKDITSRGQVTPYLFDPLRIHPMGSSVC